MSTIRDVARAAAVSISTVSIVLNGLAKQRKIPQSTVNKVFEAVRQVDYQPNLSARRLRGEHRSEYTIAVFWAADTRTSALTRVLLSVQKAKGEYPYDIQIEVCPFVPGRLCEVRSLRSMDRYNGAILATLSGEDLQWLESSPPPIPIVLFNRDSKQFSTVHIDNMDVGRIAADLFLDKGLNDLVLMGHNRSFPAMSNRRGGFLEACRRHGITLDQHCQIMTEDTMAGGAAAGRELITRGLKPQGIFCDDDSIALGLLSTLWLSGVRIPDDVKIVTIGLGSPEFCRYSVPPLTVVELPLEEMAAECLSLLVRQLRHQSEGPISVIKEAKLYIRESCR